MKPLPANAGRGLTLLNTDVKKILVTTLDRVTNAENSQIIRENIPTFQTWKQVPDTYATRHQWLKRKRKVRPGENPQARWAETSWRDTADSIFQLGTPKILTELDDIALTIDREIGLYHIDQTEPVNHTQRTLAYMDYEDIFFEYARKNCYLQWSFEKNEWSTKTAKEDEEQYWRRGMLTDKLIRRHINQRDIIGIRATQRTRYISVDHDFHGRDRQVFLDQTEVLLRYFHGAGTWHQQIRRDDISGMHYIGVFEKDHDLDEIRGIIRSHLQKLDEKHPELSRRARLAGMPSFAEMEVYPDPVQGFRLPMSRGYQVLLDRPLPLVTYLKQQVQDVIGYMKWLANPDRKYMPKQEILDLLYLNLEPSVSVRVKPPVAKPQVVTEGSGLGSLKNCCRQKLTNFWTGNFNPHKSLNQAVIVTARIFYFEGVPQHQALDLINSYIRELPPSCSQRLQEGDFKSIENTIRDAVKKSYLGNKGQKEIDASCEKLEASVGHWREGGFRLSDKSTWDTCWSNYNSIPNIEWNNRDCDDINNYLQPVLGKCIFPTTDVAQGICKLTAVKHCQESGIAYGYWQSFLSDTFGLHCARRNKIHDIVQASKDLDLISVYAKPIWGKGRKGLATMYCPGSRVKDRIVLVR